MRANKIVLEIINNLVSHNPDWINMFPQASQGPSFTELALRHNPFR